MLKMTKLKRKKLSLKTTIKANNEICLKPKLKKCVLTAVLKVSNVFMLRIAEGNIFQR